MELGLQGKGFAACGAGQGVGRARSEPRRSGETSTPTFGTA